MMARPNRRAVVVSKSVPAPVGGLNARDAIANMKPTDALVMDNWFPETSDVRVRSGYSKWATGFPAAVESLMTYSNGAGRKLFAASGTALYECTATGAIGAAAVSGLTNARWLHINVGTAGGQFLYAVNGTDSPLLYDGTNWAAVTDGTGKTISSISNAGTTATLTTAAAHGLITGNKVTVSGAVPADYNGTFVITVTSATTFTYVMATAPAGAATTLGSYAPTLSVTGVNTKLLSNINVFKSRVWFVEKGSMRVWYLPVSSIGGAATSIDFSPLFKLGGYLVQMITWTVDNASSIDDYAVFVSSEGEIAMYRGTDPASASTWALAGMFRIGRPVGPRGFVKVGSDVVIVCADGFFPLSKALLTDRSQIQQAISNKIGGLASADVAAYSANFGWQIHLHPIGNKLLVNVPANTGTYQYVMNTITGAWCRFTGWAANCFESFGDKLMFGGSNFVAWCDQGNIDDTNAIIADLKPAFSYFGSRTNKKFTMVRPLIQVDGKLNLLIDLNTDFADAPPRSSPALSQGGGSQWNLSAWNTSPWQSGTALRSNWQSVFGIGFAATLRMRSTTKNQTVILQSTDFVFESGGIL